MRGLILAQSLSECLGGAEPVGFTGWEGLDPGGLLGRAQSWSLWLGAPILGPLGGGQLILRGH